MNIKIILIKAKYILYYFSLEIPNLINICLLALSTLLLKVYLFKEIIYTKSLKLLLFNLGN